MKTLIYRSIIILLLIAGYQSANATQSKTAYYCPPCSSDCDQTAYASPGLCPHCGMKLVQETTEQHDKEVAETAKKAKQKPYKVLFYLQDGVEVLDFAGPMEVFVDAGFEVVTISKTKEPIKSQGVLKVTPDYSIADAPQADIIAFFGGNSGNASNDPAVIAWLKKTTPQYYLSVCTGAFILGKAGLLDSLTVTTFHESIESLRKAVPKAKVLSNVRFVDNGKVITTAGISAGIDGALHLVEKLRDRETAIAVAKYMEYDKWVPEQGLIMDKHLTAAQ
jgi:transcriptional regulator GlxA family with amidase domain/DNA-directed RNA polymerase subunit RPC12/RpoP